MTSKPELSRAEQRAYELIADSDDGVYQSDLWKALNADSRTGSKLAKSLADKGLINRHEATHDGQRTYRLTVKREATETEPDSEPPSNETTDYDSLEQEALALIRERGGLYQSQLWKELDVSSRKGSRIATSLATEDSIRRTEATFNGQRTYRLLPPKQDLDFSLLMAGELISPLIGADESVNPVASEQFSQWVLQLAQESR